MQKTCVVTDSTAIFTESNLPGQEHLYIIPHQIRIGEKIFDDSNTAGLLNDLREKNINPRLYSPSVETFKDTFLQLAGQYQEVVVILVSSHLNPSNQNAREAIMKMRSPAPIHIIDSQTTATGLGILVQAAIQASAAGKSGIEIHRIVRGLIKHIYAIFCLPDLKYLHQTGVLDPAQAIIGEMLKITPFFIMESGRLIPVQKARSSRHMVDILQEFIAEFEYLRSMSLVIGFPTFENESRNLKERINQYFPNISFSEHRIGLALATILGPNCLGLFTVDEGVKEYIT